MHQLFKGNKLDSQLVLQSSFSPVWCEDLVIAPRIQRCASSGAACCCLGTGSKNFNTFSSTQFQRTRWIVISTRHFNTWQHITTMSTHFNLTIERRTTKKGGDSTTTGPSFLKLTHIKFIEPIHHCVKKLMKRTKFGLWSQIQCGPLDQAAFGLGHYP